MRLFERGWIYELTTKVLKFPKVATTFSFCFLPSEAVWGRTVSWSQCCAGNSPQQADESVRLLPVVCLLLIRLPSQPGSCWLNTGCLSGTSGVTCCHVPV